jgi:Holliday junction resolvasome RuvABC ATP-dependent DNA helicase subunit
VDSGLAAASWCDLVILAIVGHEDISCLMADPVTRETAFSELLTWSIGGQVPDRYEPYADERPLLNNSALAEQAAKAVAGAGAWPSSWTAMHGVSELGSISKEALRMGVLAQDRTAVQDMGGLGALPGLDTVRDQLAAVVAVIEAERARRDAGIRVTRPRWKNLVFTGDPGTGKSRVAEAVARVYHDLGVLTSGHMVETTSVELTDAAALDTAELVREAVCRARGGALLVTDAHALSRLQAREQQVLRCLQEALTQFRDDLVIILAGQAAPLHRLLCANLPLAARFPVTIDFPCYTSEQLAAIFATLAAEAGFTLTAEAARKASVILDKAVRSPATGSARLAGGLLDQATVSHARRMTAVGQIQDQTELGSIRAADLPSDLDVAMPESVTAAEKWPGQYL